MLKAVLKKFFFLVLYIIRKVKQPKSAMSYFLYLIAIYMAGTEKMEKMIRR